MATFIDLATKLVSSILDLLVIMNGNSHGILQGSNEAVLAEAQGAQIGARGFNHLNDLQGTLRAIITKESALNSTLEQLAAEHPNLGNRVRSVLSPLFRLSSTYRTTLQGTEKLALELAKTDGSRLSGVTFGQGGVGPDKVRSARALISSQMSERGRELAARGISEPTKLVPAARTAGNQVLGNIRQLPITIRDASDRIFTVIGAIRALLTQTARQAVACGNFALSQALNSVGRALTAAASRFGTSLTTPLIIINIKDVKRAAGIPDADDGA